MSTVEELDLAFKADINGWLESECADKLIHNKLFLGKEKIAPEDDIEPTSLIESLESTLDYFNSTAEAKESLNRVLFRAVLNYEDFEVDFDVPRFEIGVDFRVFHHIIKHFDLYHYLYRELWKLDYQTALDFIIKSCLRFLRPVDYMHTIYIKIWHKSTQSNETEDAGSWLITELRLNRGISEYTAYVFKDEG
ncbi:hypothetical protein BDF20DRAFT_909454 [Mycotypha africana]|uniref:uncharacterized protein n=1 Tax=Mycotypha africana TaxID=64632 RepID=UPI002300546D|nr:uncharacterized protein BDF20DRAFT_909454 [Mycotypha africana]KAI8991712.1 hypothetical protein BDF20DRAFT_909454 [Mycotypha africana]